MLISEVREKRISEEGVKKYLNMKRTVERAGLQLGCGVFDQTLED